MNDQTLPTAALKHAERGEYVFPLYAAKDGRCTCGKPDCGDIAKHPRTKNGLKDATTDPATIRNWWRRYPGSNIGLATGPSRLVAIDIDPERGGQESWKRLLAQCGPELDNTQTVRTGGGGMHKIFRAPESTVIRNSAGRLAPGIDVRAEGGYIIAPPSLHRSGRHYEQAAENPSEPAPLPPALLKLLLQQDPTRQEARGAEKAKDLIPEGQRNDTLVRLAGSMRRRGMTRAAIKAALIEENQARCDPPLPLTEVEAIARSVARYSPAQNRQSAHPEKRTDPAPTIEAIRAELDQLNDDPVGQRQRIRELVPCLAGEIASVRQGYRDEFRERYGFRPADFDELMREARSAPAQNGHGSPTQDGKGRQASIATQLVELALQSGVELSRTPDEEYFASIPANSHRENRPLEGADFRDWLADLCFDHLAKAPSGEALQTAITTLRGHARKSGQVCSVFTRVGEHDGRIYVDLVDNTWDAIEVSAGGWDIVRNPACRFRRAKGMLPLPRPERGGSLEEFRRFLNLPDEDSWIMLASFLIAAFFPSGPYPILSLGGGAGSAKSTTAVLVRALADPAQAALSSPPKSERDLVIAARNSWCIALDNVSSLAKDMSNALCRLCYGSGLRTRRLYTDAEEMIFSGARPIILNGIPDYVEEPDLVDRCIPLRLPEIEKHRRRRERELLAGFGEAAPRIFGGVLDVMVHVMAHAGDPIPRELPRMADFAELAYRAAPALGWAGEHFLSIYEGARTESLAATIENSYVAMVVQEFAIGLTEPWAGTATVLKEALEAEGGPCQERGIDPKQKPWPQKPVQLSNELKRMAPALKAVGVRVDWTRSGKGRDRQRMITIGYRPDISESESSDSSDQGRKDINNGGRSGKMGSDDLQLGPGPKSSDPGPKSSDPGPKSSDPPSGQLRPDFRHFSAQGLGGSDESDDLRSQTLGGGDRGPASETEVLADFCQAHLFHTVGVSTTEPELFEAFGEYCTWHGRPILPEEEFTAALIAAGVCHRRTEAGPIEWLDVELHGMGVW